MDSHEIRDLLEECLKVADKCQESKQPTEEERQIYCSCRDSLCAELASLLQEAMEMKWPFVPEKWQFKQSIHANDKTNLSDLISKHLSQLLALLKVSIVAQETRTALAVIFLVDRFLYWTDESSRLLKITRLLNRDHPEVPVAPQLVIRQARVYLNSGKLQKAEYILSSLINRSGETGCWVYQSESDRALVQAVSVQVRGSILQKLGLWLEAAELIWASLVGYYALPQPDKKGIGTSLGILANILVSMNDEDFQSFRSNPDIDLSLLGDQSHRLLSAAQTAKMAVIYSQYTSLYVLTHVVTRGTCLLSYSFSMQCPASQRRSYLQQAVEAFEIGLLTKAEGELITSIQELHTFIKAAYSLTVAHKWLGSSQELVEQSTRACEKALATFYDYCKPDTQGKDILCAQIMHQVAQVKLLLRVQPFLNYDEGSFIPDSYKSLVDTPVEFSLEDFTKVIQRFKKYHESVSETADSKHTKDGRMTLCIAALGTTVPVTKSDISSKTGKESTKKEELQLRGSNMSTEHPPPKSELDSTLESTDNLGSSWQKFSLSSSGSPRPSNSSYMGNIGRERDAKSVDQSCPTHSVEDDDKMLQSKDKNRKRDLKGCNSGIGSHTSPRPAPSSLNVRSNQEILEGAQSGIETLSSAEDLMTDACGMPLKPSEAEGAIQSLSQLTLRTPSSSLSDSFGSKSSWEKVSLDLNSPGNSQPQPRSLSKAATSQLSKSQESDECIFDLETPYSATSASEGDWANITHKSGLESRASSSPRPLQSLNVNSTGTNRGAKVASLSSKPANKKPLANPGPKHFQCYPGECESTEPPTERSFEVLESGSQSAGVIPTENMNIPVSKNPLCYSCRELIQGVVPERQYFLSQKDYLALLAGVCHECLLRRLQSDKTLFQLKEYETAYNALHLKFSKATGLWTARETCVYIGELMNKKGGQRRALWVQFLHQEERLSRYVGKDYLLPKGIQFHLKDVERQMIAQYYVTEFNKSLYDKEEMTQIFFIPSEALLLLNGNEVVGCVTVEPYMLGDFVKLTNNTVVKVDKFSATKYGLAFGHFTYLFSECQEIVVDLQGWVTANGKGLSYLTDPQIHSTKTPKDSSNFAARGIKYFLEQQHGPECNDICRLLKLPSVGQIPDLPLKV